MFPAEFMIEAVVSSRTTRISCESRQSNRRKPTVIDAVQFRLPREDFDFDITMDRPSVADAGRPLRPYFSSQRQPPRVIQSRGRSQSASTPWSTSPSGAANGEDLTTA